MSTRTPRTIALAHGSKAKLVTPPAYDYQLGIPKDADLPKRNESAPPGGSITLEGVSLATGQR